jgi:hypothetical protein
VKLALLAALALSLCAQDALDFPRAGEIVDAAGSVRELRGLAGAFTLGPAKYQGVISIGCNGRTCLAKTADQVLWRSGVSGAPSGPAIFGFEGERALIYFPETRQFARWSDSGSQMLDWAVDGEVLAVRPRGESADLVVRRNGAVWVVEVGGEVRDGLPSDTIAALLLPSGIVYATSDTVVVSVAGVVRSLTVAVQEERKYMNRARKQADTTLVLYELDPTHVVAQAGNRLFLIAIDRGEIFELPAGEV